MAKGIFSTELWMERRMSLQQFRSAFRHRFPRGSISSVIEHVEGRPGYRHLEVKVPLREKEEVVPFFESYCKSKGVVLIKEPRSSFPRAGTPE
jgi:hypothetical protein